MVKLLLTEIKWQIRVDTQNYECRKDSPLRDSPLAKAI